MQDERTIWQRGPGEGVGLRSARTRRSVLRGGLVGVAGLAGAALIGCGDSGSDGGDSTPASGVGSNGSSTPASGGGSESSGPLTRGNFSGPSEWWPADRPFPYNFPEPDLAPKSGGTLRIGATWDTSTWDAVQTASGGTIVAGNVVYNRLLQINNGPGVNPLAPVEVKPELASSWEVPDENTYTFTLNKGVKYHNIPPVDGRELVANDLKLAFERYASEGVHTSYFKAVDSIEAVDDYTVQFKLNEPNPDFLFPLGSRYLTMFPPELVDQEIIDTDLIGTGPMIVEEVRAGDRVTLKKNPDYWQGEVLLDGVNFRIMPDASARLAALRAGQLEYAYSPADTLVDVEALLGTNPDMQINMTLPAMATFSTALNLADPRFADVRVRRALSLLQDREAMVDILYKGLAKTLPTIPWLYVFDSEPTAEQLGPWWRTDVAEAKKLLAAAGQEDLSFELIYFQYSATTNTRQNEILVDQFRQGGVDMRAQSVDYTTFNSQWVGGEFKEAADGWLTLGFSANNFFFNHLHSASPGNRWGINDPMLDELAVKQSTMLDADARREVHTQIHDQMRSEVYRIERATAEGFQIYAPTLRGLRFGGPLGSNSSYYEWGPQMHHIWLDQ